MTKIKIALGEISHEGENLKVLRFKDTTEGLVDKISGKINDGTEVTCPNFNISEILRIMFENVDNIPLNSNYFAYGNQGENVGQRIPFAKSIEESDFLRNFFWANPDAAIAFNDGDISEILTGYATRKMEELIAKAEDMDKAKNVAKLFNALLKDIKTLNVVIKRIKKEKSVFPGILEAIIPAIVELDYKDYKELNLDAIDNFTETLSEKLLEYKNDGDNIEEDKAKEYFIKLFKNKYIRENIDTLIEERNFAGLEKLSNYSNDINDLIKYARENKIEESVVNAIDRALISQEDVKNFKDNLEKIREIVKKVTENTNIPEKERVIQILFSNFNEDQKDLDEEIYSEIQDFNSKRLDFLSNNLDSILEKIETFKETPNIVKGIVLAISSIELEKKVKNETEKEYKKLNQETLKEIYKILEDKKTELENKNNELEVSKFIIDQINKSIEKSEEKPKPIKGEEQENPKISCKEEDEKAVQIDASYLSNDGEVLYQIKIEPKNTKNFNKFLIRAIRDTIKSGLDQNILSNLSRSLNISIKKGETEFVYNPNSNENEEILKDFFETCKNIKNNSRSR